MVRELLPLCLLAQAGCSVVLDFSDRAIPIDASPFTPEECGFQEPNDTFETASVFAATDVGPAAICATGFDDRDFYRLTIPAATASLTIEIGFVTTVGDLDLYLYNADSQQQALSVGTIDNEKIVCPGESPRCDLGMTPPILEGDYTFEVRGATPGTQNNYSLAVTLTPQ